MFTTQLMSLRIIFNKIPLFKNKNFKHELYVVKVTLLESFRVTYIENIGIGPQCL